MNTKRIIISAITVCTALGFATIYLNNLNIGSIDSHGPVLNQPTEESETSIKEEKISVYDFINETLVADGFTYLGGTKWGRGEKNFFIFDLAKQEFQMADNNMLNVTPEDWYISDYDKYISLLYKNETNKLYLMDWLKVNPTMDEKYSTVNTEQMSDPTNNWYELPIWMNLYLSTFKEYGCDITDLSEAKLNSLKAVASKATKSDVQSVFDIKSTDGVLRYYSDVHVDGAVEDSSRYIEIQSMDEFLALKSESGFQLTYMINVTNSNTDKPFESDDSSLQAGIIKEFVKDVVYPNTPARDDVNKTETIGVYFINIDNPNGNFKNFYTATVKNVSFNQPLSTMGKDFRNFKMPYSGTVIGAEKDSTTGYSFIPFSIYDIEKGLEEYIWYIKYLNPEIKLSFDFIRNYSRPFAYEWQAQMGLTALFDAKYGMVDHSIKYIN